MNTKMEKIIKQEGIKNKVKYKTYYSNVVYVIKDNHDVSWDKIMTEYVGNFNYEFVPKFGKFEIEKFVGEEMLKALLVTKNITDLFNTDLICDDSPYNVTQMFKEDIISRCGLCFDVVSKNKDKVVLMFKWKPYDEICNK